MNAQIDSPLADLPLEQLQAEINRRREAQLPEDKQRLITLAQEIAAVHGIAPKRLLVDCAEQFTQKREKKVA